MVDGNLKYAMFIRVKAAERTNNNVIKSIILMISSSKDIYNLKELLYNEGIADIEGLPIVKPDNRSISVLPNSY